MSTAITTPSPLNHPQPTIILFLPRCSLTNAAFRPSESSSWVNTEAIFTPYLTRSFHCMGGYIPHLSVLKLSIQSFSWFSSHYPSHSFSSLHWLLFLSSTLNYLPSLCSPCFTRPPRAIFVTTVFAINAHIESAFNSTLSIPTSSLSFTLLYLPTTQAWLHVWPKAP